MDRVTRSEFVTPAAAGDSTSLVLQVDFDLDEAVAPVPVP